MSEVVCESIFPEGVTFGKKTRCQVGSYDSKKKHKLNTKDDEPVTRIEMRYKSEGVKVKSLDSCIDFIKKRQPFSRVRFYSFSPGIRISKPQDRMKFDFFCLLVLRYGHRIACQRVRSYDPAHSHRWKSTSRRFQKKEYRLDEIFHRNLNKFLTAPISQEDHEMLTV